MLPTLHLLFSFSNKYTQVSPSLQKGLCSAQPQPHIPSLTGWVLFFVLPNVFR